MTRPRAYLELSRLSNLPTVWTNVLAGTLLAGWAAVPTVLVAPLLALSCFYVGGMFLNDAFDHRIDADRRPARPIPAGAVGVVEVYVVGFGVLVLGELILVGTTFVATPGTGDAAAYGALLAGAIVYYDWRHKRDPLGPVVMAGCRGLTYVTAAAIVAPPLAPRVLIGALAVSLYVGGLTVVAKTGRWGRGTTVAVLIAGIALVDASLIVMLTGQIAWGIVAAAGFPLTLLAQRIVSGT